MDIKFDFGLVGLGVMGRNFILNVADHDFSALGLTSDEKKIELLKEEGAGKTIDGTTDIEEFVSHLSVPRKIMLLVPAGDPVDAMIDKFLPLLEPGDLLIDGGNTYFSDTDRRMKYLNERGIHFLGSGVSGGSKGARFGPSIMPGGNQEAYALIKPVFEAVAAKVDGDPCVAYLGSRSAGNYVKMIHNGIEYGLMQLISEVYDIMKRGLAMDNEQLHNVFDQWNHSRLQSFLIEITADVFTKKDELTGNDLVDMILDKAKQKGTGKWTSQNAMDLGIPIPTIDVAVSAREISGMKTIRESAEPHFAKPSPINPAPTVEEIEEALYFSFIISYSQGMTLLAAASEAYDYDLNMEDISRIWRGGCIIRAALLEDMRKAYSRDPVLPSLLLDPQFIEKVNATSSAARKVLSYAIEGGFPVMALASAITYFDAFRTGRLPLNLIQAQRDHFGSHTYERTDQEGIFHTEW